MEDPVQTATKEPAYFARQKEEKEENTFSYGPPDLTAAYAPHSLMWWFPGTVRLSLQQSKPVKTFMRDFQSYFELVQRTEFVIDPDSLTREKQGASSLRWHEDVRARGWYSLIAESPGLRQGMLEPPLDETQIFFDVYGAFKLGWIVHPIAANEYGHPVGIGATLSATGVPLDADVERTSYSSRSYSNLYHLPRSGTVYILPAPNGVSVRDGIDILLASVLHLPVRAPEPAWANSFTLPGQDQLEKDLAERNRSALAAEHQLELAQAALESFTQPLGLLYETDAGLEHLVRDVFREMGATVEDPISANAGREDGILKLGPRSGVLEVKSHKRVGFSLKEMRQLNQWVDDYYERTGKQVKGIFVGNHEATIEPTQRGQPFPDNALNFAVSRQFCVLTSVDLFAALCAVRSNQVRAEAVLESIFRTIGRWDPKDPIRASKVTTQAIQLSSGLR